jgi:hypothetical protein
VGDGVFVTSGRWSVRGRWRLLCAWAMAMSWAMATFVCVGDGDVVGDGGFCVRGRWQCAWAMAMSWAMGVCVGDGWIGTMMARVGEGGRGAGRRGKKNKQWWAMACEENSRGRWWVKKFFSWAMVGVRGRWWLFRAT